jgi:hypothetical protein
LLFSSPEKFASGEIDRLKAPLKKEAEKQLFDKLFAEIETKHALSLKGVL